MHRAVASSSGSPTDLRRSDCLSGSHQPKKLRTRCGQDSMEGVCASQPARLLKRVNPARLELPLLDPQVARAKVVALIALRGTRQKRHWSRGASSSS